MSRKTILRAVSLASLMAASLFLYGQTVEDHVRQGDEYFAQYDDAKALDEYKLALQMDAASYEALWRAARASFDLGDLVSSNEAGYADKQRKLYDEAIAYARQAIQANPNGTWGYFFRSAAMGKYVLTQGKKEQINASKTIKASIEKAIELDPANDLAYHALGRWHRRMAEIGGAQRILGGIFYGSIPKGTFAESEKYLLKAIELRPDYTNHHLELGRTYAALKKFDLAREEFQKVLDLPQTSSKCPIYKKEAQAELDQLKKKK